MRKNCFSLSNVLPILYGLVVTALVVSTVLMAVSCKMTAEGVESIQGDMESPVLMDFSQLDESSFELVFSETVVLENLQILENDSVVCDSKAVTVENVSVSALEGEDMQKNACVMRASIVDSTKLDLGKSFVLAGVALDQNGNSLSFGIPFYGYNDSVAGLVLSEVRADATKAKVEFVELYVYRTGNIGGVTLYSANDDDDGEYVFPAADVKKGEYIVVHFRKLEEQSSGCIDETGSDLNFSTAADSCADARDFWVEGTEARIGKSDVILLRERMGGKLLDCVAYAEDDVEEWKKDVFVFAITEAEKEGVWHGGIDVSGAASSQGITNTRTLSRQNIPQIVSAIDAGLPMPENNASCWLLTKTSSASPGAENSTEAYVP